ncbi:hypothetical protein OIU74_020001 [Salix koriyanagi]|uniref:Uncharacterized protein n=1 Tax=Salix koriyanagi TaxID=2511006 RepID=A0A9Q0SL06_9ROSI|nr:hypothetical protein OIU74_020001 [Salix koriyanagi]
MDLDRWYKARVETILTKRPITPSEEEERLNRRCRSAKAPCDRDSLRYALQLLALSQII